MSFAGLSGGQYQPLSPEQVETIHLAALRILAETGFTYESGLDDTLDLLEGAGARVDRDRARIFFPAELVEAQAARSPEQVILYSRDGANDLDLGRDRVHAGTGGMAVTVLDPQTGQARPSVLGDIHRIARLVDRLNNIHFFLRPCTATDLPPEIHDLNAIYAGLTGTSKHFMAGAADVATLEDMVELAALAVGGADKLRERPIFSLTACFAISPLKLCTQSTLNLQTACRLGIPVALSSAPMAGSTAPMTMAGVLALVHAEELAGLTIGQLTTPGAPLLYGGIPGAANMRTMGYQGGSVECGMMNAAIHQLADRVKVPNYNSSGLTDAKLPDAQAGWEKGLTTLLAVLGGSNYIHHAAGMLESMLAVAYEQYVIDDEIIGQCGRVLEGIAVDEESLALETIAAVGPGGNYMMAPHTLKHMRTEFNGGNGVSDRLSRDKWAENGGLDAMARARAMALDLLSQEAPQLIPDDIDAAIRDRFDIRLPKP